MCSDAVSNTQIKEQLAPGQLLSSITHRRCFLFDEKHTQPIHNGIAALIHTPNLTRVSSFVLHQTIYWLYSEATIVIVSVHETVLSF